MSPTAPPPGDPVTVVAGRRASTRPASSPRRIAERLLVAAIAALVLLGALSSMGGTYAYWSDETALNGTLETGSASLEATLLGPEEPLHAENLLPGDTVPHQVALRNTGDVPLAVSVTASGTIAGASHPLDVVADDTSIPTVGPVSLVELGPGESRTITLTVTAPDALGPDDTMDIALQFEGEQIR